MSTAANIINNTDLNKISQTVENGKRDKLTLKKPVKLQGEWNLDPSKGYQFKTELAYEKGKQVIEIDSPSFLGGNGNRLGPMAYCVAGITSCFIATFVSVAATKGIKLSKLNVNTECIINFAKTFDVADEPITEGINFEIEAQSDNADKQQLQKLVKIAEERCPAMYNMKHEVKVNASVK
ncbi:MAG TPA: OsmC family protein [Nitrososphaeraceae archaeon]|nr:OsmC family protein [Nitrososphaeraceae archaeon]